MNPGSWFSWPVRDGALRSGPVRVVVLLLAAVLATACTTACTTAVEGTPSASTGVLLPPRPPEVRLDGVDPCSLLTAEQRASLDLDGVPLAGSSYVELFRGEVRTCTTTGLSRRPVAVSVGLVTTVGIERWQETDLAAEVSPVLIQGFPAVLAVPTRSINYCSVEVDVAIGQLLDVQASDAGGAPPLSQSDLCQRAGQFAEEMMKTLLRS